MKMTYTSADKKRAYIIAAGAQGETVSMSIRTLVKVQPIMNKYRTDFAGRFDTLDEAVAYAHRLEDEATN